MNNQVLTVCFFEHGFRLDFNAVSNLKLDDDQVDFELDLYHRYLENHDKMLFFFGFDEAPEYLSESMKFLYSVSLQFLKRLALTADLEFKREKVMVSPTKDDIYFILGSVPYVIGMECIDERWIQSTYEKLSAVFSSEIADYDGPIDDYLSSYNSNLHVMGSVFFHLVEQDSNAYPFAFLATYSNGNMANEKSSHIPLKSALTEFEGENDKLLKLMSSVTQASQKSGFIAELVESGEIFSPLRFTADEAYTFLTEVELYETCGILSRIPDWWKTKKNAISIDIKVGDSQPSKVGLEALLSFEPSLYFDEEMLSEETLKSMLNETSGLSLINGKWVEVNHEQLSATLAAYEKAKALFENGKFTMAEAMRLQLNIADLLNIKNRDVNVGISHGEWLKLVTNKLKNPALIEQVALTSDFKAVLREYQEQGFNWLRYLNQLGFGACLADDMGLGKTVQVIALLESIRITSKGCSLLIIPASLMGNWQRELERFSPELKFEMIYNKFSEFDLLKPDQPDLYITTYGMVARLQQLSLKTWDLLVIDEAQAIKNPTTKQTKAVKAIRAKGRIALTGTPIENSLSDLWSLFDFLNSGLLGTSKEFKQFIRHLREHHSDYSKLKEVVNPFIMRRLKTDKSVIADLPDKIEMKAYTTLSKKQVVLYQALVKELTAKLEASQGIGRKGLVLSSIMKFKQICNHPDHYLRLNEYELKHSGKFLRLQEICETIYEKRERVLVFTQFREMTTPIANFLETIFKRSGLILHGGTPVKKRAGLVDEFCGEAYVPFMVLSLKAGGVGLNLTAANHVIHFDRWWNPAVENQATDRAFRIGQKKNVMVHKLITSGTIEEKIDLMIEEKNKLAGDIIASTGESWITEMDNDQLLKLFTLQQVGDV
ncbi:ATP-dependent helicase [Fusibacter sp. A1]|nr:DEAD/DEAH box helicase [Fusibacter sp. A1]RXV63779.1 ATP-dependent helicase [Fusibacter sp. A1]